MRHSPDEKQLIIAALLSYRDMHIQALNNNISLNDAKLIQGKIDETNNLLAKYGY
jgi:hypothetical protein